MARQVPLPVWGRVLERAILEGAKGYITAAAPENGVLVALDEDTAMVGDGATWAVHGRQGIHVYRAGAWSDHRAGASFDLALV